MIAGLLQPSHLIIILIVVLIIFGPGKLPSLGGAVGKSIREFRGASEGPEETPEALASGGGSSQTIELTRTEETPQRVHGTRASDI